MSTTQVPLFQQPIGLPYCGAACAKMILAFYGRNISLSKIVSRIDMTPTGVDMARIGSFFLKRGFSVKINIWLDEFPNRFIDLDKNKTSREILKWCRRADIIKREWNIVYRFTLPKFLKLGGMLETKPPSLVEIGHALRHNIPLVLSVNSEIFYGYGRGQNNGHYVVATAINKKGDLIIVNDPAWKELGGIRSIPIEKIIHACYKWNAGVIFIKPK